MRVLYIVGGALIIVLALYIGDRLRVTGSTLLLIGVAPVLLVSLILGGVLIYGSLRPPRPVEPEAPREDQGDPWND